MPYDLIEIKDAADPAGLWDSLVEASPEGWFWADRLVHDFRLTRMRAEGRLVADRSFFLSEEGRPLALVPCVFAKDPQGQGISMTYSDAPLPWPMVIGDAADRPGILDAAFDALEERAREGQVGRLSLMLSPPGPGDALDEEFARIVRRRSFIDTSKMSHYVQVGPDTLSQVRERYRRYVKKFSDLYDVTVHESDAIPTSLASDYMALHIKDAGGFVRPIETYERQIDVIRREGFCVMATNKAAGRVVGILLINLLKGAAYDSSVAVDPEFQDDPVSNLLKWNTIQHLLAKGVTHYELGTVAKTPTMLWQPSAKNYGISFFKEGWSRGSQKSVRYAEKFYSRDSLKLFWDEKFSDIAAYFQI